MSYLDIFVIGWNLNTVMVILNLFLAISLVSNSDKQKLQEESMALEKLKNELDKYYPYKVYETILSYLLPFVAFYKIFFRFIEMYLFFQKNEGTKMFDFMIYKYSLEIEKAKNSR